MGINFDKEAVPSTPSANTILEYYDQAGPGYNTPFAFMMKDENGIVSTQHVNNVATYRFIKVTFSGTSGAGTWTPANGCRLAFVECWGAGAQGGGGANCTNQISVGGGGGGGAYAAKTLTGSSIKSTSYSVGAKGSGGAAGASGGNGANTTWDTNVIIATGGTGGGVLAAGTAIGQQAGGAGGAASGCTGDIKYDGGLGGTGIRFSATLGFAGSGGMAAGFPNGAGETVGPTAGAGSGTAGTAATAGAYGSGGGGGICTATNGAGAVAGGNGMDGAVRIWEYA